MGYGSQTIDIAFPTSGSFTFSPPLLQDMNQENGGCVPMGWEKDRLQTFHELGWPAWANMSPEKLAKAGFFYTGNADEVECFSCAGRIDSWQLNDQAILKHQERFPLCPFLVSPAQSGNVALGRAGRPLPSTRPQLVDLSCSGPASDLPQCARRPDTEPGGATVREEAGRLATFSSWPKWGILHPSCLAQAGFFYTGRKDVVQCAFCGGRLEQWEGGDVPIDEHRLHFPQCSFLEIVPTPTDPEKVENDLRMRLRSLGVFTKSAPSTMATLQSRLGTFVGWPADKKQTPENLARAGLFYCGVSDSVKCFHCNGGLRNWLPSDCAFQEHYKWFPDCDYVFLSRGEKCNGVSCVCGGTSTPTEAKGPSVNGTVSASEDKQCKICMDVEAGVVLLPCGHLCCCLFCAPPLRQCPICRREVAALVRAYFS